MKAIILAAGKGTRFNSEAADLPKSMRLIFDRPILSYVLDSLDFIDKKDIYTIVKFKKEKIISAFPELNYIEQGDDGYGTGYAVECASDCFADYDGDLIVICGDTPLISGETIKNMIEMHHKENNSCTILSCKGKKGQMLGRMVRNESGKLVAIVEAKDCTKEQFDNICEYNAATYIFNCRDMFNALKKVTNSKATNEKYLTDVPEIMMSEGLNVNAYVSEKSEEILGVNSPEDLAIVESFLKNK